MLLTISCVIVQKTMSHVSQGMTLRLSFVRNTRSHIFFKIDVIKNFVNFTGKHLCWSLFLIKFKTDSKTDVLSFFTEHLRWLILKGFCKGTSLVKILQFCHFNIFGINHRCFRKIPLRKIMNNCDC